METVSANNSSRNQRSTQLARPNPYRQYLKISFFSVYTFTPKYLQESTESTKRNANEAKTH